MKEFFCNHHFLRFESWLDYSCFWFTHTFLEGTNITNADVRPEHYVSENDFISPSLRAFDQHALLAWLRKRGLNPVLQKANQYFCPDSSRQIVTLFQQAIRGVDIRVGCTVHRVASESTKRWRVETSCGRYEAPQVVVATGGISFPRLGATDIGYQIAEGVGHTIIPPRPALVGLTLQKKQAFFKKLSGLSTLVQITVSGKTIRGNLLFAHKGISGPAVLDASLYWQKGRITINWVPGLDWGTLQESQKQISTLLPMPRRMAKAFLKHLGIEDKAVSRLRADEMAQLRSLCVYEMAPAGTFGYAKAEVTRGGVSVEKINSETMESTLARGLYFIGEALDVTGRLGGYNLQWAFSSAAVCAKGVTNINDTML